MSAADFVYLEIESPPGGARLDLLVLEAIERAQGSAPSRARLKSLFQDGAVELERARDRFAPARASERIEGGARARIPRLALATLLAGEAAAAAPEGCFLPIVYEDSDLLVLHKSSGVPSLPHATHETRTAVSAALARDPALAAGKSPLERGLLHRLDTGTSGLLAFARTEESYARLRERWKDGGVRKIYRALVFPRSDAAPPRPGAELTWMLAHDASSDKRMIALRPDGGAQKAKIRGKPLEAHTRILEVRKLPQGVFDLTIAIRTGVMHQIRCHLATAGWPIVGDPIYGGDSSRAFPPADRLFWLHALRLELTLESGLALKLQADLPEGWPA